MNEEQALVKEALETVRATGGTGVLKSALLSALRTMDGRSLTPEQKDVVWSMLERREWITYHMEPLWHNQRWTITDRGMTALEAM